MKYLAKTLLLFCLTATLFSCANYPKKRKALVAKKIECFINQRGEWNRINQLVLNDSYVNAHLGKQITLDKLKASLSSELKLKGIVQLSLEKTSSGLEVEYLTNWTEYPIGTLYLTQTTEDTIQTKKGYYKKYPNSIEVWGLGNHWLIWIDSDFM
ncbi:MAG: hypothetical protein Q8909_05425 [Bacteroidota bacterium]|nr:hypothetical protein [Bacteroidota bacterium]